MMAMLQIVLNADVLPLLKPQWSLVWPTTLTHALYWIGFLSVAVLILAKWWWLLCAKSNPGQAFLDGIGLSSASKLRNRYYALRHGQSTANVDGIVSSLPAVATVTHGLTGVGVVQARQAGASFREDVGAAAKVVVVTSPFRRAKETAFHFAKAAAVEASSMVTSDGLMERSFGNKEGLPNTCYADVWAADLVSADHTEDNVESVNSVRNRAVAVLGAIEREYDDCDVVLVSHGDTLQILQTAFACIDPRLHRSLDHLDNAVIRGLQYQAQADQRRHVHTANTENRSDLMLSHDRAAENATDGLRPRRARQGTSHVGESE